MLKLAILACLTALPALPAAAQLLPDGQDRRELPFEVVLGKPLLAVTVNGQAGRMMFDNGTPEMLFLNRDAAALAPGLPVAEGFAASGQKIMVELHDAPQIGIGGLAVAVPPQVPSGDFGFAEAAFGADFMGFIGSPMVEAGAFLLDYDRAVLTVLRTGPDGALRVTPPDPAGIVAEIGFVLAPGGQPTMAGLVGQMPIAVDLDTGDDGTIYLRPETRTRLLAEGLIDMTGSGEARLSRLQLGDARLSGLELHVVEAGGPQDKRAWPGSDFLRLGARFLAQTPSLWNFPAGTFTLLRRDAEFLR